MGETDDVDVDRAGAQAHLQSGWSVCPVSRIAEVGELTVSAGRGRAEYRMRAGLTSSKRAQSDDRYEPVARSAQFRLQRSSAPVLTGQSVRPDRKAAGSIPAGALSYIRFALMPYSTRDCHGSGGTASVARLGRIIDVTSPSTAGTLRRREAAVCTAYGPEVLQIRLCRTASPGQGSDASSSSRPRSQPATAS